MPFGVFKQVCTSNECVKFHVKIPSKLSEWQTTFGDTFLPHPLDVNCDTINLLEINFLPELSMLLSVSLYFKASIRILFFLQCANSSQC